MVKVICILLLFTYFIACVNKNNRTFTESNVDGFIVKGYKINDSLYDDTVCFYTSTGSLVRKEYYENGKLNGGSCTFYLNGVLKSETNFNNGRKLGVNNYFDSLGKKIYSDYYYYDIPVGPITYYNPDGTPKRFFFASMDNQTLMDFEYSSWTGVEKIARSLIYYTKEYEIADSIRDLSIFLYIIKPPKISTEYKIVRKNKKNTTDNLDVLKAESIYHFKIFSLPELSPDYFYSMQVTVYDSILNKKTVIRKEM